MNVVLALAMRKLGLKELDKRSAFLPWEQSWAWESVAQPTLWWAKVQLEQGQAPKAKATEVFSAPLPPCQDASEEKQN